MDRFDVDVVEKPFFMLLSKLPIFDRNHLHVKVPMVVGVSDTPRHINDVPKYLVLKSLNDVNVALFRASPQLHAVGPHRIQYLYSISLLCIDRTELLLMSQYIFLYFGPSSSGFCLTCPVQYSDRRNICVSMYSVTMWFTGLVARENRTGLSVTLYVQFLLCLRWD